MNQTTTTKNGFRVEDITFRNARRQSEIENEIERDDTEDGGAVQAPVSLTPEQVKTFYLAKIEQTNNIREKKVYAQTIKWIDDLLDTKKKLIQLEEKVEVQSRVANASSDDGDIQD